MMPKCSRNVWYSWLYNVKQMLGLFKNCLNASIPSNPSHARSIFLNWNSDFSSGRFYWITENRDFSACRPQGILTLRDVEFRTGVALSETPEFRTPRCGVEIVKHRALLKPIYRFMKNTHSILRGCVEKTAFVTNARSKHFQLLSLHIPFYN